MPISKKLVRRQLDFATNDCGFSQLMLFLLILAGGLLWLFPTQVLSPFSAVLVTKHEPGTADAIIVLIGGRGPERLLKAYELSKQGFSQRIAFGSGYVPSYSLRGAPAGFKWDSPGDVYRRALKTTGFDESRIHRIDTSRAFDTSGELEIISEYARRRGWVTVILVTSASHSRRVDLIWRRVSLNMNHYTVPSELPGFDEWWRSSEYRRTLAYEYAALLKEAPRQIASWFSATGNKVEKLREN